MSIVLAIICYAITAFLIYNYFNLKTRLEAISSVETSDAAALNDIYQGVAGEVGKGYFEQPAEIKGVIECENPLESEIGKHTCVYYRMSVTREWEEDYDEKDGETGKNVRKTRKGSEVMSSNTRSTRFLVRDETGTLLINPEGAQIDTEKIVDRFEAQNSVAGGTISFGGFSFSLGGTADAGNRRTLGHRFHEEILALNKRVYVLGNATDMSGELMIQKPREKGQFIISTKSEEELMASSQSGMKWSLIGAVVAFLAGNGCILWYFMAPR